MRYRLSRRGFLKGLLGSAFALATTGAYAVWGEPGYRLSVTRYAPQPPQWPSDLHLTMAVVADLHVGEPHMSLDRLAEIVDATNALQADLSFCSAITRPDTALSAAPSPCAISRMWCVD
jgi:predicted MPP superfamily phosphohydrolase